MSPLGGRNMQPVTVLFGRVSMKILLTMSTSLESKSPRKYTCNCSTEITPPRCLPYVFEIEL